MRSNAALLALLVGCTSPVELPAFEVNGAVYPGTASSGSVLALWAIPNDTGATLYKWGDGTSVGTQFQIAFYDEPPAGALDREGLGVALLVQLPGIATLPDGIVANPATLRESGVSADHAIIYKRGAAPGPAWSAGFGPRFSCARCVRDPNGDADGFELAPCLEFAIRHPLAEPCRWY